MTVSKKAVALATDVDGTLIKQSGLADSRTRELLHMLSRFEIKIGPATGKGGDYCQGLAVALGVPFDHIIAENGADCLTRTSTEPLHWQSFGNEIRSADLKRFVELIGMDEVGHSFLFKGTRVRFSPQLKVSIRTLLPAGTDVNVTAPWQEYFNQVIAEHSLDLQTMRFVDGGIDIIPTGVSKGLGIDLICEDYSCSRDQIITAGDSQNDYELLRGTRGIAVGNAKPEIKQFTKEQGGYISAHPHILGLADGLRHYAHVVGILHREIGDKISELFGELPQPQR